MADDPDRDILPVKEGAYDLESCRSLIDPRERHLVVKLDRFELEDRYLRLLEEANNLKKISNAQEDKIKRLATKLMRISNSAKTCGPPIDSVEDKNKISALEAENSQLKDKVTVLRSQLLSHTLLNSRASTRSRSRTRPSSGLITSRSENYRTRSPSCVVQLRGGGNERETVMKIEKLEMQKQDLTARISQLEKEVAALSAENQREKVAENIECIRVWRQMKQLNDKLVAAQDMNTALNLQINDLKKTLHETTISNQALSQALEAEKQRIVEIKEQMSKSKNSESLIREKDEQIRSLSNEMDILQEHNNELVNLSLKYGQIEHENAELKKTVNKQISKQETLTSVPCVDQASIGTLQAANKQLLGKLQELQTNMDSLSVQLLKFKSSAGTGCQQEADTEQVEAQGDQNAIEVCQNYAEVEKHHKCCRTNDSAEQIEKAVNTVYYEKPVDEYVQTECVTELSLAVPAIEEALTEQQQETGSDTASVDKRRSSQQSSRSSRSLRKSESPESPRPSTKPRAKDSPKKTRSSKEPPKKQSAVKRPAKMILENPLAREQMIKILDQAQITSQCQETAQSLRAPCCTKIRENLHLIDCSTFSQQRQLASSKILDCRQTASSDNVLRALCNMIQDYSTNYTTQTYAEGISYSNPCPGSTSIIPRMQGGAATDFDTTDFGKSKDSNPSKGTKKKKRNLDIQAETRRIAQENCSAKTGLKVSDKTQPIKNVLSDIIKTRNRTNNRCTGTEDCSCSDNKKCSGAYGARCCSSCSLHTVTNDEIIESYPTWRTSQEDLRDIYLRQLDKCRKLLGTGFGMQKDTTRIKNTVYIDQQNQDEQKCAERKQSCVSCCPQIDCGETSTALDAFPLVITDNQGLVEIHIICLQLSTCAANILFCKDSMCDVSVFVSWELLGQETAFTPTLKCPRLNFNSSFVYRISDLYKFFHYILSEYVVFHANVVRRTENAYVAARAKLCIKDILDYPQNKLHYIAPANSVIPCSLGMNFGQLSLWVRLSCDVGKVDCFKKQFGLHAQPEHFQPAKTKEKIVEEKSEMKMPEEPNLIKETTDVKKHDEDGLLDKEGHADFSEDSSPPTPETNNTVSQVFKPRARHTPIPIRRSSHSPTTSLEQVSTTPSKLKPKRESFYQLANEGYKHGRSSSIILVDEAEDESSVDEDFRALIEKRMDPTVRTERRSSPEPQLDSPSIAEFNNVLANSIGPDAIIIEISNVTLFQRSSVMHDEEVRLIYVEYSFLGHRGADMETVSLEKPKSSSDKLVYNFRKKFYIDEMSHPIERKTLKNMLDESINPNIKFILVSEPLPEETDIKECVEIGIAYFNIREYALGDGYETVTLPIMTMDRRQEIGVLEIYVLGLEAIRDCLTR